MLTIFVGEQREGRIKFTTDRDCLSPDIIRFDERIFVDLEQVKDSAKAFEARGYKVCIDTLDYFYETEA